MVSSTVGRLNFGSYKLTLIWADTSHIIVEEEGYPDYSSNLGESSNSLGWNVYFSGDYYEGLPGVWEPF